VAGRGTGSERAAAVVTAGRWPWRLASAKKCVATYLPNSGARKMDGADPRHEAPDAMRGRGRARAGEGGAQAPLEARAVQILEVVATL